MVKVNVSNIQNNSIIKTIRENLKLDKNEKNTGDNHGNKRNVVKQNQQSFIFESAKQ